MKFIRVLKILKNNFIYLCRNDISNKGEDDNELIYRTIRHTEDLMRANMVFSPDTSLKVLNDTETWNRILREPKSIVRIGDGEITLIEGKSIGFQKYDKRLADYLIEILRSDRTDLYTGIDYNYFNGFDNVTEYIRRHNYLRGAEFKKTLVHYCNPEREYISACFNQIYIGNISYDREKYINNIKSLFCKRNIVVFSGKGVFEGLQYNVFDNAQSCEYVWGSSSDSFDEFDSILAKARKYGKDKTLCFVLGPTSKALVYELSREGYTAWDLGHMVKDYDCCLRNASKEQNDVIHFFAPDI